MSIDNSDDLNFLILNCLQRGTVRTCHEIWQELTGIAEKSGGRTWAERTVGNHLDELIEAGKVRHQEKGYRIEREWKEGQPKAFILIELETSKNKGENNQKKLMKIIKDGFEVAEHKGLNLISVDAVLGAEFSVIVQVYSDSMHYIGRFVKEYLLTNDLVKMTRTVMVWPTEPGN